MTRMRFVCLPVIALAACGGTTQPDAFDDSLAAMEALATKMCACTDAACSTTVQAELTALRKTFRDKHGTDKASAAQEKRGRAFEEQFRTCRTKARGDGQGFDAVLTRLDALKTEMCACTDKACTTNVETAWKEYRTTLKDQLGTAATPNPEQDARGTSIDAELRACLAKYENAP
jgi:hypothetical protein